MFDVVIVGGGPVGFVTALGLAQAGASICVVEAEAQIIKSPRAAVYHWSVLDGLERLGIREQAEVAGFAKRDYLWLVRSTGERIGYDLSVLEGRTAFPYNIHLGQDRLAEIAGKRLQALPNAEVRFNARLLALTQDQEGVMLQIERPNGTEELHARYAVGADGAASTVRKSLGIAFDGMTWPERFVATNVRHDFETAGYGQTTMVVDDRWGAVIVKITPEGLWRCTYMEDAALPEESVVERVPEAYRHLLTGSGTYSLDAAAPYRMHQRCAARFRLGRVLLAGDAAHVTNPTGGLGLTTGLFDAFALWPTLASLVLDDASPALLDRYAEDRRCVFLGKTSPQAIKNKQLVFHACGRGPELEAALEGLRTVSRDSAARFTALQFVKNLETVSPVEAQ